MKSSSALSRTAQQDNEISVSARIPSAIALKITNAWMTIDATENMLAQHGAGIVAWRAAPQAQSMFASMAAEMLRANDRVMCVGFQAYPWMAVTEADVKDTMRVYLGKKLPDRIFSCSAEDAAKMVAKPLTIVALHVEKPSDWNEARTISAAAVKAGTPLLMLISADVDAPEGVAIETFGDWATAVMAVRDAVQSVRHQGAIRVMAMTDINVGVMERTLMSSAQMSPEAWQEAVQKNNDGAETAANAAYQSPVESF